MSDQALLERCRDRGYTPGARDVARLLELWRALRREPAQAKVVAAALCRGDGGVARKLEQSFAQAEGAERALRLRTLARIAGRVPVAGLPELLDASLEDPEPRVVREAVRAVGKLGEALPGAYEDALLRVAREAALPEQRAAVEALGRIGGEASLELLDALRDNPDPELQRRAGRARTLLERRRASAPPSPLALGPTLEHPAEVRLRCRGAGQLVAEEARALLSEGWLERVQVLGEQAVHLRGQGSPAELQRLRTPLDWGLVFPLPQGGELGERIIAGVEAPALARTLQALTDGPVRFRLSFVGGGHRRALVWRVAQTLDARAAALRNDSRGVSWTVEVDEARGRLVCLPRERGDRFAYRVASLPASSHPTLAALMARVAAPRSGERVWDPFCGCAAELIECERLAPGLRLRGTDRSPEAIAAARANVAAAGLEGADLSLTQADVYAGSPGPEGADVILTNPPMGRRTALGADGLHASLARFVDHAARVLAPGGRLVWVTPSARATAKAGRSAGLRVEDHGWIDMSGMQVTLQVLRP